MLIIKRPIVCFPAIDWHYLFHRPQQLMTRLALAGHPVHFRNITQIPGASPEEVAPHLWVYPDFNLLPTEIAHTTIYFIYFPPHAAWIDSGGDKFIIYDCIDDDPEFAGSEDLALNRADLVLCVSEQLLQKFKGKSSRLLLLSNGVDVRHYFGQSRIIPHEMQDLKSSGAPVVGFSGAFYRGWVDMELVYRTAREHGEWCFVIIGESYRWDFSNAPANLIYLGPRPYEALPDYIHCFDAGWIPFMDNQIARGADPVKLYEYLASRIPVISRDLPFIRDLKPPLVYAYRNPSECSNMIIQALNDNKITGCREQRRNFAAQNTWDMKVDQLLQELAKLTWLYAEQG